MWKGKVPKWRGKILLIYAKILLVYAKIAKIRQIAPLTTGCMQTIVAF
jgi:hypothetical protein